MTSMRWYFHRLRAMSAAEIVHRLEEKRKKAVARRWRKEWGAFAEADGGPVPSIPGLRARIEGAREETAHAAARASARLLDGGYEALGVAWPAPDGHDRFPAEIWRLDPVTGRLWPGNDRYTFDIPYRHERTLGDIKYVWEFNRLQFLQPLAADVLLNGDAEALAAIERAIESWHAANPPFRGIAWNSGIELALRAISLLVATSLCGERLSPATRGKVREMLKAHLLWIDRFPSRFSSANNHRIAEAAGTFLIASAMPELAGSARLRQAARAVLVEETGKQVLSDGVAAEQSPTYGAFTVEFVLLCAFAAENLGAPFPVETDGRLKAFASFVAALAEPDGTVPSIGDDDEGRVLIFCRREPDYAASVAASVAGFHGEGASSPSPSGALRHAIFGGRALAMASEGMQVFDKGGYSVARGSLRGRRYKLVLDHGPLGYLSIAAHGHADALSVLLSLDGRPVLVDPGTYLYHSGGAWRDWFRSTPAHNTLSIGGESQSTIAGAFNWSHKAEARLDEAEHEPQLRLRASHDGYLGRFGVSHERTVSLEPEEGLSIVDRLVGARNATLASLSFQLAPDLSARVQGTDVEICNGEATVLAMVFPEGEVSIARGGEPPHCGWVSPAFGLKEKADRIVWNGEIGAGGSKVLLRF